MRIRGGPYSLFAEKPHDPWQKMLSSQKSITGTKNSEREGKLSSSRRGQPIRSQILRPGSLQAQASMTIASSRFLGPGAIPAVAINRILHQSIVGQLVNSHRPRITRLWPLFRPESKPITATTFERFVIIVHICERIYRLLRSQNTQACFCGCSPGTSYLDRACLPKTLPRSSRDKTPRTATLAHRCGHARG